MEKMIIQRLNSNKMYLSDNEIIDISPDIIHEYKLKEGMDISNIYSDILFDSIKQKAFFYLYLKSRTKYELISKLKLKYKNTEIIKEVINYLETELYINDVDYATAYILSHKYSRQKQYLKLMQKGIIKKDIDLAFENIPNDLEEDLIDKEIIKMLEKNIEPPQIIIKLTRKGYEYTKIVEALNRLK
ncbi:regulatory protein RecX [Caviibacter abscessus]|uniref:regulatory protein RecX n=1 Tax=Caviibacter abscessus TaxID=1766719 RepID=UPI0008366CEC|nr:RecX family transcriptional regulator [Caviibacter abscessus]